MTSYRYVTTDLVTGQLLADSIPLDVSSFSQQLNGGGTLTGTLPLNGEYAVNQPYIEALECRRAVLWVLADEYPAWCGVVWDWPDTTRADGNLPISAQTIDSVFSRRLITLDLQYVNIDVFSVFIDLCNYGTSKTSKYAAGTYGWEETPPPAVTAQAQVAGLVYPPGKAGVSWTAQYLASDLTQVSEALSDLATSGNLEYAFTPGLSDGNLVTNVQLGYVQLGRYGPQAGYQLSYPGNCTDYGYQRTGSQSANVIIATAPVNGSSVNWDAAYPHGYDLADLAAGYPLMEDTADWQQSTITSQAQVNAFADGTVALRTQAMTTPVITVAGPAAPEITDLVLGDTVPFTATSPLHPPGPRGEPGLAQLVRVTGWEVFPPGPGQSEHIQITTSGVLATPNQ